MPYTVEEIASLLSPLGCSLKGKGSPAISFLLTDSRSLRSPEETLFFALRTDKGDGHRYVEGLYQRGVRAFVVSGNVEPMHEDAAYLLVSDTLEALQLLSRRHRERFNIPVIGVTGSNGKTTVKEWLFQMLGSGMRVTRSPRSYNSQVGVPLSVWNLSGESEIGIFEAGISKPGEMQRLEGIIQPTLGVFTCLGDAHQENFASLEQKCREKLSLFRNASTLVYAEGNPVVDRCVREMAFKGKLVPVRGSDINRQLCQAVCLELGMKEETVRQRALSLEPVAMRLEVKEGLRGCTIINDAYNSDFASLDIALDFLSRRPDERRLRRALILSDIQQTGVEAGVLYRRVASLIKSRGVQLLLGVGAEISRCASCFRGTEARFFPSTSELLQSSAFLRLRDSVILIKGARSFHFERIVESLERRLHETTLAVDLNALIANLDRYRSFLREGTRIVCMVKADAYGAGAREVARVLQDHNVDYLAVATADEGVELRRAGITTGIMVMNPEMNCLGTLFAHGLEPEVYSMRLLEALIEAGKREGITGFPVHIKLDTGMHRLGFSPLQDMARLVDRLRSQEVVLPRSVFSHFAGSDSPVFDSFTREQYKLFLRGADALQKAYPSHRILRHISNSAAIERLPETHLDMVRLGLGLYGVSPIDDSLLNNVSTLTTTILQIRDVPRGDTVGYSRRWTAERASRIAALPIGYADGLDRRLGNGAGHCVIQGKEAPYVGNICMDVSLVDVTGIDCQEGDRAIVFGEALPVSSLA
ncbi:MAG: alanine racemase, partial [Prevotellaceae bacterium]|nr:alanine racemase [Prevotellaceae bacterium]